MRDITKITPEEYLDCLEGGDDRLLREQHQEFLEEAKAKKGE
ncbi:3413_t:CDS:1, partial [Paraglomus brasilianum]